MAQSYDEYDSTMAAYDSDSQRCNVAAWTAGGKPACLLLLLLLLFFVFVFVFVCVVLCCVVL
jgi:hypothetical protein